MEHMNNTICCIKTKNNKRNCLICGEDMRKQLNFTT